MNVIYMARTILSALPSVQISLNLELQVTCIINVIKSIELFLEHALEFIT